MSSPTTDISVLFATDPMKLTRTDVTAIVEEMRRSRVNFNLGNLRAGNTKAKPEAKKKITTFDDLDI